MTKSTVNSDSPITSDLDGYEVLYTAPDGTKHWRIGGRLHRGFDEPAVVTADGTKEWWVNGERHRVNSPAIEYSNGTKEWWMNGQYHRGNGLPAIEKVEGTKEWWVNGKRHRESDLPAIETSDGTRQWWVNGKEHRESGPAHIGKYGDEAWYQNGIRIIPLRTKLLSENAKLPSRASSTDAGLDLYSTEAVELQSLERKLISTGVSTAIPNGFYGRIADRSGNAYKLGLHVMAGVIDSGYRGEIKVLLVNLSNVKVDLPTGSKIAQLIITKIEYFTPVNVETLDATDRNEKGFGSSGT